MKMSQAKAETAATLLQLGKLSEMSKDGWESVPPSKHKVVTETDPILMSRNKAEFVLILVDGTVKPAAANDVTNW